MSLPTLHFLPRRAEWLWGAANPPWARRLSMSALALGVAVLLASAWHAWQQQQVLDRRAAQLATLEAERGRAVPVAPGAAARRDLRAEERRQANLVIRRLNTPWPAIFDALEQQASGAVTTLAIEPDIGRGAVRVQTEGQRLEDLLQHAERLQGAGPFGQVRLLRIDRQEGGASRQPRLTFDLLLTP